MTTCTVHADCPIAAALWERVKTLWSKKYRDAAALYRDEYFAATAAWQEHRKRCMAGEQRVESEL